MTARLVDTTSTANVPPHRTSSGSPAATTSSRAASQTPVRAATKVAAAARTPPTGPSSANRPARVLPSTAAMPYRSRTTVKALPSMPRPSPANGATYVNSAKCAATMTNVTLRTTPSPGDCSVGTTPPDRAASGTAGSRGSTRVTAAARTSDNPATASIATRQVVIWPSSVASGVPSTRALEAPTATRPPVRPLASGRATRMTAGAATAKYRPWHIAPSPRPMTSRGRFVATAVVTCATPKRVAQPRSTCRRSKRDDQRVSGTADTAATNAYQLTTSPSWLWLAPTPRATAPIRPTGSVSPVTIRNAMAPIVTEANAS